MQNVGQLRIDAKLIVPDKLSCQVTDDNIQSDYRASNRDQAPVLIDAVGCRVR